MNLKVEREELRGADASPVTLFRPIGELDLYTAAALSEALQAEPEAAAVVVDLDRLEFIDSTGLGVLVAALQRARQGGGRLSLVATADVVLRPFRLTGLGEVFDFHDTVDDALAG
jgi:anti-sigma B factor antagonist